MQILKHVFLSKGSSYPRVWMVGKHTQPSASGRRVERSWTYRPWCRCSRFGPFRIIFFIKGELWIVINDQGIKIIVQLRCRSADVEVAELLRVLLELLLQQELGRGLQPIDLNRRAVDLPLLPLYLLLRYLVLEQ